jgi:hypothetical protein
MLLPSWKGMERNTMVDVFGIALTIILVGTAAWVLVRMHRMSGQKKAQDNPQIHCERAVWAWAKVVACTQGKEGYGGMVQVVLELDVHLPGTAHYTATTTWLVEKEMLGYVEMGKEISLKVDPQDPKYIYPNGSWAKKME